MRLLAWLLSAAALSSVGDARAAIAGLAASPAPGGAIAVWEDHRVARSTDGGRSFTALPVGPHPVLDVAVGDGDALFVLAGDAAGAALFVVRGPATTVTRVGDARRLAVSGRDVAALGATALYLSHDGGASFVRRAPPAGCAGCPATFSTSDVTLFGGSALVADLEVSSCGSADVVLWQRLVAFAPATTVQRAWSLPAGHLAARWRFGAYGWAYGVSAEGALFAQSARGPLPVEGVRPRRARLAVAHNGRATIAWWGGALFELFGAKAVPLGVAPADIGALAVDGEGRALVGDGGALRRFSRLHGWESLGAP